MFGGQAQPMKRQSPGAPPPPPAQGGPIALLPPEMQAHGEDEETARRRRLVEALRGGGSQNGWDKLGQGMGELFAQWMKRPAAGPGGSGSVPSAPAPQMTVGPGAGGLY